MSSIATKTKSTSETDIPKVSKERKERKPIYGYCFGPAAPPADLPFPIHANITVVELLTFLPNSVRCADVIYRFISNGGTRRGICRIVNAQRQLSIDWTSASCGNAIYHAMHRAGYVGWTVKLHHLFHNQRESTWDEARIDVASFRTPGQVIGKGAPSAGIPFKNLGTDVRQMPSENDALDLTRMVQYCVQRPEEHWMYPRDYGILLGRLGGPTIVRKEHLDGAAFNRWLELRPPQPRPAPATDFSTGQDTQTQAKNSQSQAQNGRSLMPLSQPQAQASVTGMLAKIPAQARSWRYAKLPTGSFVEKKDRLPKVSKDSTTAQSAASAKKPPVKANTRMPVSVTTIHVEAKATLPEPYIRPLVEYVAPPSGAEEPTDESVKMAWFEEGAITADDSSSAYAFGGPRQSEPYRMLRSIYQPHPDDLSGWAENLRWASEQRACFPCGYRSDAWKESPEHMELIAKTRKEQVWASDELVDQILEEQLQEEEDRESPLELL